MDHVVDDDISSVISQKETKLKNTANRPHVILNKRKLTLKAL